MSENRKDQGVKLSSYFIEKALDLPSSTICRILHTTFWHRIISSETQNNPVGTEYITVCFRYYVENAN